MREFGSEHSSILLPDGYFNSLNELGLNLYLRSGREALLYIATMAKPSGMKPVILFPAYCCWSMSAPFEKAGWRLIYYRLNDDLTVDVGNLNRLLIYYQPQAVLTMNFYGAAYTNSAVKAVKEYDKDCIVIEDFSHCTFSIKQIYNEQVDFYVSSIRKSIGVCDGAVVIGKTKFDLDIIEEENTELSDLRYVGQKLKGQYAYTKQIDDKDSYLADIREGEAILNDFSKVYPITNRARMMLQCINAEEMCYARKKNFEHLYRILYGKVNMPNGIYTAVDGVPFSLPILVDDRDHVQKSFAQKGLYAPVLWPICDEARKACVVSAEMADKMLSIPIDQRYDYDDIEDIAKIILEEI